MIDWNGALEAVHADGRVISITDIGRDSDGDFYSCLIPGRTVTYFNAFDGDSGVDWVIRNMAPAWRTSDEQLDRMDALVKRIVAASGGDGHSQYLTVSTARPIVDEARAILAAREPVDPDIAIAQQICDRSPYDLTGLTDARLNTTKEQIREAVLTGIKYGRAQA